MTQNKDRSKTKNIGVAFFLNFGFTIIEIIGGLWTNSMAILSDALHDLGDSLSLGVSWYLQKKSKKQSDSNFTFGYRRFSLLGALFSGLVLIIGSFFILSKAIPRLFNPEHTNASGMLWLSIGGIIVNGIAAYKMHKGKSVNENVLSWHLLEDLLGWVAVLIVSIILIFKDIHILDPILSILITLYVLYHVIKHVKKALMIFLEAVPEGVDLDQIKHKIKSVNLVLSLHHTHIWSLDGEQNALSTHIVVPNEISKNEIINLKEDIRNKLNELELNFSHITLEVELKSEECPLKK